MADAGGAALPIGNEVRLGYFDDGFQVAVEADDLTALQAAWHQYDGTTIGTNIMEPGRFGTTAVKSDASFDGKKAYWWILKTTDNTLAAADFSNVVEYGLFSGEEWEFPVLGTPPPGASVTFNTGTTPKGVTEAIHGSVENDRLKLEANDSFVEILTYALWAADPGVFSPGTPDADRLESANPDGDELTNLEEFYHGSDPLAVDISPIAGSVVSEDGVDTPYFELVFARRRHVQGVEHEVEMSAHLQSWESAIPVSETVTVEDEEFETVRIHLQVSGAARHFFRLRVFED